MNALVVGASSGLGRAISEELAARGYSLLLVSSDERDLAPLAKDLALRHGVTVRVAGIDLRRLDLEELRRDCAALGAGLHGLFVVAGYADPERDAGMAPDELVEDLIAINFTAPVRVVNAFLPLLAATPGANCVGIGSVAAVRGRPVNAVYGACKRGLEHYFEAVRHVLAGGPCRVQFYRVGYMHTALGAGRRRLLPAVDPRWVARAVVRGLGRDRVGVCLPAWWGFVLAAYALMPSALVRRLRI